MTGTNPIDIAQALIRCPSVTPADEGALQVLIDLLEPAGFTCTRLHFDDPGSPAIDNLYAKIGEGHPHFCFAGHTDVVPIGDRTSWEHDPFGANIIEGTLYGRGAVDMKGGVAAFAAAALRYGAPKNGAISLLITGDEEGPMNVNGTKKLMEWLEAHGDLPDACIVGEPTSQEIMGDMIKVGRRGSLTGTITVTGKQGHVAYPDRAANPVPVMAAIVTALTNLKLDDGNDFFQPSHLEWTTMDVGNPANNVLPEKASGVFNIRFNDIHTHDSLEALLENELKRFEKDGFTVTAQWQRGAQSFFSPPKELADLTISAVESVCGRTPVLDTVGGTSDARFIHHYCPVLEFGLLGRTAHHVDEHTPVADLEALEEVYFRLIEKFFG